MDVEEQPIDLSSPGWFPIEPFFFFSWVYAISRILCATRVSTIENRSFFGAILDLLPPIGRKNW